jgi:hypothetical protein
MTEGLSKLQQEILAVLPPDPFIVHPILKLGQGGTIHLPKYAKRTGEIIRALGVEPSPQRYASVSRSLNRLMQRDLVQCFSGSVLSQGKGYSYTLIGEPK